MRKIAMLMLALLAGGCTTPPAPAPAPAPVEQATPPPAPQPVVVRDPQLEQKLARTELLLLEKEAQVTELESRLDDARREVVRAMAKSTQLATRAEAASGIAEAEIAVRNSGAGAKEASRLMQQCTAEFDKQNYAGALYLANQAKIAALATRGQGSVERNSLRDGEMPFALPLRLQTTSRANVREGPGSNFTVAFTLPANSDVTGYSYTEQWVRISDANGRRGWVFQGLIGRKP
jgi:hypothetical protein